MKKEELKPCPFCGGEVTMERGQHHQHATKMYYVGCERCGQESRRMVNRGFVVTAWNTRSESKEQWTETHCALNRECNQLRLEAGRLRTQLTVTEAKFEGIDLATQNRIRDLVVEKSGADDGMIDGSGCDSGDPVDLTLDEIAQGFNYLFDEVIEPLRKKLKTANDGLRRWEKAYL